MEDKDKKLYPTRFIENLVQMPWGSVSYKIADLGFVDSMVAEGWFGGNTLSEMMGTYLERVVGDDSFEYYGLQFPLLVKEIKTSAWQPLQVNAPDQEAEQRYDSLGKTAFWQVLEATDDARMFLGFKRDVEPKDFYERCLQGRVTDVLREIRPKAGDRFLIKPGTVFAAGPGLTILEISECSELTFNLLNPDPSLPDLEDMMLEEAFDLIDYSSFDSALEVENPADSGQDANGAKRVEVLEDRDEFKVTRMELIDPLHIFSEQPGSFAIYYCLSGEAIIQEAQGAEGFSPVILKAGQIVLVPSEVHDFLLLPSKQGTSLLEATVGRRIDPDSYIGSSPEPETTDIHLRNWN